MTGGWAATNTLREGADNYGHHVTCASVMLGEDCDCGNGRMLAALALVETALDAADEIGAYAGSGDVREPGPYALVRVDEIDALAAALRAVAGGRVTGTDPLDRIEEWANRAWPKKGQFEQDVLALVAVARAAQRWANAERSEDIAQALRDLRVVTARLDGAR